MPQTLVTVDLPQEYVATAVVDTPSPGSVIVVGASGDLQAAINAAIPGDTITLATGAVYSGTYTLPAKTGASASYWITIKTAGTMPSEGTRVTPATALSNTYPKLRVNSVSPVLQTNPSTCYWRFMGIEIDVSPTVTQMGGMVLLGDGSAAQNDVSLCPHHIILDRCYVHGHSTLDCRKALTFDGTHLAVVDSYVSEIHSLFDAQAITGTNGPGPFRIYNNYLEASTETIAWGGADPGITDLVPSDIHIARNHITRKMAWRGVWLEKELIESKNSRRVLCECNVIDNTWVDGQYGWVFGLWSVNQQGGATWCVTEHWTIRNNLIRNVSAGFSLTAKYPTPSPKANHIAVHNNILIGVDNPAIQGFGLLFSIYDVAYLSIEHNTAFTPYGQTFNWALTDGSGDHALNQIYRNNLMGGGQYQVFSGYGQGSVAWALAADSGTSQFVGNVIALANLSLIPGNFYPQTLEDIGLAGGAGAAYSVAADPADLALASTSAYKLQGTDGTDPGADVPAVILATAGVTEGSPATVTPVVPVVTSIVVTLNDNDVPPGSTVIATAQLYDQFGVPLASAGRVETWTVTSGGIPAATTSLTNASGIATMVVTVGANGASHIVRCTDQGGIYDDSSAVTVTAVVDLTPASVVVSPTAITLASGATRQLSALVKNAAGTTLALTPTWTTDSPLVATVSTAGLVTYVGGGTASITAHYGAITSNACTVTAAETPEVPVLTTLTLAPATLTVVAGTSGNVLVSAVDQNGLGMAVPTLTPITSNSAVAVIGSYSGTAIPIRGIAMGVASITVSSGSVTSNSVAVTVTAAPTGTTTVPGPIKSHPIKGPKTRDSGPKLRVARADLA